MTVEAEGSKRRGRPTSDFDADTKGGGHFGAAIVEVPEEETFTPDDSIVKEIEDSQRRHPDE